MDNLDTPHKTAVLDTEERIQKHYRIIKDLEKFKKEQLDIIGRMSEKQLLFEGLK